MGEKEGGQDRERNSNSGRPLRNSAICRHAAHEAIGAVIILFYFILFYFILFYFILFYFILFYFILFYFIFGLPNFMLTNKKQLI